MEVDFTTKVLRYAFLTLFATLFAVPRRHPTYPNTNVATAKNAEIYILPLLFSLICFFTQRCFFIFCHLLTYFLSLFIACFVKSCMFLSFNSNNPAK